MDLDPDGGIVESSWGQYQRNIGSAIKCGALYFCPRFQMRLIIAAIIRLCIVLYNDHNRSRDHSFKSSSNFGTMDSDLEGVIVEIQLDNVTGTDTYDRGYIFQKR